jgi:hypothetical protein
MTANPRRAAGWVYSRRVKCWHGRRPVLKPPVRPENWRGTPRRFWFYSDNFVFSDFWFDRSGEISNNPLASSSGNFACHEQMVPFGIAAYITHFADIRNDDD